MALRRLPCIKCPDGAFLKDGAGRKIVYEMGIAPSAFRTRGEAFRYQCLACGSKNSITKQAFFALPDLGLPPTPAA